MKQSAKDAINAYFANSLGFKREDMPQMPDDFKDRFLSELASRGIDHENLSVDPKSLKPSQSEWNIDSLKKVKQSVDAGGEEAKKCLDNRVTVSKDGCVMDGSHRWLDARIRGRKLNVVKIDLPIKELMKEAATFGKREGIERKPAKMARTSEFDPPSESTTSDNGYIYHGTGLDAVHSMLEDGFLHTHKPHEFTDQDTWPDGSTDKRSYWTHNSSATRHFANPDFGPLVVLRTRHDPAVFKKENTGDIYSTKKIPVSSLEILRGGKWVPVMSIKGGGAAERMSRVADQLLHRFAAISEPHAKVLSDKAMRASKRAGYSFALSGDPATAHMEFRMQHAASGYGSKDPRKKKLEMWAAAAHGAAEDAYRKIAYDRLLQMSRGTCRILHRFSESNPLGLSGSWLDAARKPEQPLGNTRPAGAGELSGNHQARSFRDIILEHRRQKAANPAQTQRAGINVPQQPKPIEDHVRDNIETARWATSLNPNQKMSVFVVRKMGDLKGEGPVAVVTSADHHKSFYTEANRLHYDLHSTWQGGKPIAGSGAVERMAKRPSLHRHGPRRNVKWRYDHESPPHQSRVALRRGESPERFAAGQGDHGSDAVRANAEDYIAKYGPIFGVPKSGPASRRSLDEALSRRTADAFQSMAHAPQDPQVKRSYDQLKREIAAQYEHALRSGHFKPQPWLQPGQPYQNSAEMRADVRDNKHLWFFPTVSPADEHSFGATGGDLDPEVNPLVERTGHALHGYKMTYNDLFRCFAAGTLVRSRDGFVPIEKIKIGDEVLTHVGRYRKVKHVMSRHHDGEVIDITTNASHEPITVTADHAFYVLRGLHDSRKKTVCTPYICHRRNYTTGKLTDQDNLHEFCWKQIGDIKRGEWFPMIVDDEVVDIDSVKVPARFIAKKSRGPHAFELTPEFLWVVGLYIAEGCAPPTSNSIRFSLHAKETEFADRIKAFAKSCGYGYKSGRSSESLSRGSTTTKTSANGVCVSVNSKTLSGWFASWVGKGAKNKSIPPELLRLPACKLKHLVQGIMDGDGRKKGGSIQQTSEILALQLIEAGSRIGFQPTSSRPGHDGNEKHSRYYAVQEVNERNHDCRQKKYTWMILGADCRQFTSMTRRQFVGKVYDIEVEEDHSFVVQNIPVHNCVHDYYGHAKEGYEFGPEGEYNAWGEHAKMFSPLARDAMTTETHGQNSWVNFGRHIRRQDGSIPGKGDADYIHPKNRPYAEQKINILPPEARPPMPHEAEKLQRDETIRFAGQPTPTGGKTMAKEDAGAADRFARVADQVVERFAFDSAPFQPRPHLPAVLDSQATPSKARPSIDRLHNLHQSITRLRVKRAAKIQNAMPAEPYYPFAARAEPEHPFATLAPKRKAAPVAKLLPEPALQRLPSFGAESLAAFKYGHNPNETATRRRRTPSNFTFAPGLSRHERDPMERLELIVDHLYGVHRFAQDLESPSSTPPANVYKFPRAVILAALGGASPDYISRKADVSPKLVRHILHTAEKHGLITCSRQPHRFAGGDGDFVPTHADDATKPPPVVKPDYEAGPHAKQMFNDVQSAEQSSPVHGPRDEGHMAIMQQPAEQPSWENEDIGYAGLAGAAAIGAWHLGKKLAGGLSLSGPIGDFLMRGRDHLVQRVKNLRGKGQQQAAPDVYHPEIKTFPERGIFSGGVKNPRSWGDAPLFKANNPKAMIERDAVRRALESMGVNEIKDKSVRDEVLHQNIQGMAEFLKKFPNEERSRQYAEAATHPALTGNEEAKSNLQRAAGRLLEWSRKEYPKLNGFGSLASEINKQTPAPEAPPLQSGTKALTDKLAEERQLRESERAREIHAQHDPEFEDMLRSVVGDHAGEGEPKWLRGIPNYETPESVVNSPVTEAHPGDDVADWLDKTYPSGDFSKWPALPPHIVDSINEAHPRPSDEELDREFDEKHKQQLEQDLQRAHAFLQEEKSQTIGPERKKMARKILDGMAGKKTISSDHKAGFLAAKLHIDLSKAKGIVTRYEKAAAEGRLPPASPAARPASGGVNLRQKSTRESIKNIANELVERHKGNDPQAAKAQAVQELVDKHGLTPTQAVGVWKAAIKNSVERLSRGGPIRFAVRDRLKEAGVQGFPKNTKSAGDRVREAGASGFPSDKSQPDPRGGAVGAASGLVTPPKPGPAPRGAVPGVLNPASGAAAGLVTPKQPMFPQPYAPWPKGVVNPSDYSPDKIPIDTKPTPRIPIPADRPMNLPAIPPLNHVPFDPKTFGLQPGEIERAANPHYEAGAAGPVGNPGGAKPVPEPGVPKQPTNTIEKAPLPQQSKILGNAPVPAIKKAIVNPPMYNANGEVVSPNQAAAPPAATYPKTMAGRKAQATEARTREQMAGAMQQWKAAQAAKKATQKPQQPQQPVMPKPPQQEKPPVMGAARTFEERRATGDLTETEKKMLATAKKGGYDPPFPVNPTVPGAQGAKAPITSGRDVTDAELEMAKRNQEQGGSPYPGLQIKGGVHTGARPGTDISPSTPVGNIDLNNQIVTGHPVDRKGQPVRESPAATPQSPAPAPWQNPPRPSVSRGSLPPKATREPTPLESSMQKQLEEKRRRESGGGSRLSRSESSERTSDVALAALSGILERSSKRV